MQFPYRSRAGFSLIEVALAIAVGLMVLGATVLAFNQVNASSKMASYKTMVSTIQGNISMDKFRLGQAPPMTANPPTVAFGININTDSVGRPYYPQGTAGELPADPVLGKSTLLTYDSTLAAIAIEAGAPTAQWDNPVFATAEPTEYGKGGWLYDPATGAFRANISNQSYPSDRPSTW